MLESTKRMFPLLGLTHAWSSPGVFAAYSAIGSINRTSARKAKPAIPALRIEAIFITLSFSGMKPTDSKNCFSAWNLAAYRKGVKIDAASYCLS